MSTGQDSTLGEWKKNAVAVFGSDSKPVQYLDQKIKESPNGEHEEVIADEGQMLNILGHLYIQEKSPAAPPGDKHDG